MLSLYNSVSINFQIVSWTGKVFIFIMEMNNVGKVIIISSRVIVSSSYLKNYIELGKENVSPKAPMKPSGSQKISRRKDKVSPLLRIPVANLYHVLFHLREPYCYRNWKCFPLSLPKEGFCSS